MKIPIVLCVFLSGFSSILSAQDCPYGKYNSIKERCVPFKKSSGLGIGSSGGGGGGETFSVESKLFDGAVVFPNQSEFLKAFKSELHKIQEN